MNNPLPRFWQFAVSLPGRLRHLTLRGIGRTVVALALLALVYVLALIPSTPSIRQAALVLRSQKMESKTNRNPTDPGACQGTCRLSHAIVGKVSEALKCALTTESRSGLSVTASM